MDLIDRLVMKQRKATAPPAPLQRLAMAARTLAHDTPLNALTMHLELLRNGAQASGMTNNGQTEWSFAAWIRAFAR